LIFTDDAARQLHDLEFHKKKKDLGKLKKVRRCLGLLQTDPKYNGLYSHKYEEKEGLRGEDVWESYVENRTPGAWRLFWFYGPGPNEITILLISPHP
jgi:hypothetical protein